MRPIVLLSAAVFLGFTVQASAQESPPPKRGWFSRVLHPFGSSEQLPRYKDKRLRGLVLGLQLPPGPIKLSEMRQLPVNVTLTNRGKQTVELSFPTDQRIEIYLRDAGGAIVTRWSDNRAFEAKAGSVLINPNEHLEYAETIATRDLSPDRVFTVEVFLPAYPDLDVRRKSIAAP